MAFSSVIEDMEEIEIVFTQRLASGEPAHRQQALRLLRQFISNQCTSEENGKMPGMSAESLSRLAKGLHYAMWMQDKPLLQEELASNIAELVEVFKNDQQSIEYVSVMIKTLSKEWPMIDRWRMDKFLMLVRRFFRVIFFQLADEKWDSNRLELYLGFLRTILCADSTIFASIKYHCVSLLMDELDNAGSVDENTGMKFLGLFADLLAQKIPDPYFQSICTDIFDAILHDFSEQLTAKNETRAESENDDSEETEIEKPEQKEPGMIFDYSKIADLLFQIGKMPGVSAKRRKRLYELSKRFDGASKNINPFTEPDEREVKKLLEISRKSRKRRFRI